MKTSWTKEYTSEYNKAYRKANKDKLRELSKVWRTANRDINLQKKKDDYNNNKEARLKQQKEYAIRNKDLIKERRKLYRKKNWDKILAQKRQDAKRNPGRINANTAKRRALKLQRTPKWLTKEDIKQITQIYKEAKRLQSENNIKYHVDHTVPLVGDLVSGLHVPSNLQIIPAKENYKKSNKFTPGPISQISMPTQS